MTLGIGFIGAGRVVQSVHIPTLARLGSQARPRVMLDPDKDVVTRIAGRLEARVAVSTADLVNAPNVDIVVICSPPPFHAVQVGEAIAAGAKVILCEKPLAVTVEEVERIGHAVRSSDTALIVGAMHTFDPGWRAAKRHLGAIGRPRSVRLTVSIPPNALHEDRATEFTGPPPPPPGADLDASALIRMRVLALAVHDLPLIRTVAPAFERVRHAALLGSGGFLLAFQASGVEVQLMAHRHEQPFADWALDIWGERGAVRLGFTPSFVHAGSMTVSIIEDSETRVFGPDRTNGYEEEWHRVLELGAGIRQEDAELTETLEDARYVIEIADAAAELLAGQV